MKAPPKLVVFHPSIYKPTSPTTSTHRLILFTFLTLSTFTFLISLLKHHAPPQQPPPTTTNPNLSATVSTALLHYATASAANSTSVAAVDRMTAAELSVVATALLRCSPTCNVLIFGFTHETLLWKSLNFGERRRTVFVDENEWVVSKYEANFTDIEAYDAQYTTKVRHWKKMIEYARAHRKGECRPHQNLLFSECKLAINDLPNHLYEILWDVILIDGPRGYSAETPGRMGPIFSAGVMARSRARTSTQNGRTHVFVHDYGREIERVYSEEFLCKENLVEVKDNLAHFVVKEMDGNVGGDNMFEFCIGDKLSS